jgi:Na+-transporting NADH:ubiquinone oxidoreductase subunit F
MLAGILTSLVFLCGAGAVIALLLVLAEKKILNYGPCRITVNNGEKTLTVQGGGTLLAGLASGNIFVPSACGGRGTCVYCKVKVTSGGGVPGPVEVPLLSPQELKAGVRLSCQVKIRNDLQIEIPKELFSIRRFSGTLER